MTWFMSGRKLIIESSISSWFFADLQSFSQIWNLVLTARRNLAGNSLLRHSFALKMDLWQIIMFERALRHWDPTLSSPKIMLLAAVNIIAVLAARGNSLEDGLPAYLMLYLFDRHPLTLG